MDKQIDLSVIVVSYNTKNLLERCLSSLYQSLTDASFIHEIIVVDNHSTDGSSQFVRDVYPDATVIENSENVGFGKANNQGIKKARGEIVLLLNSDAIAIGDGVAKLLSFTRKHKKAFVGGKLLNLDHTAQTSCGPFFSLPVVFASLFLKGDTLRLTRWSPKKICRVDWVSGACLMAPKRIFEDDLYFDERIFLYMEEIELLYRAKKKGYPTYFYPFARFLHVGSASSLEKRKGPVVNIYRGLTYLYAKHYPRWKYAILKALLRMKAVLAFIIGFVTGNEYLRKTYAEAYRLV